MSNNPLRQYFRRPAVYLKLPSGGDMYTPDVLEMPETGELPVYPMTAIDEITARTPDALFNGTAVTELIKSCVPAIKNPWEISNIDIDSILIAIKSASMGDELEIDSDCPSCETHTTYNVSLMTLLSALGKADYSQPLETGDLTIKFKPLRYKDMNEAAMAQFEVQKVFVNLEKIEEAEERLAQSKVAIEKVTLLTMEVLSKAIESIQTPTIVVTEKEFILDFLKHCDKNVYNSIRDFNSKLKESSELKPLEMKCSECGHEYKQTFTLDASSFFG